MVDINYLSASDLLIAYARKELSPVEVARAALDRIDAVDGQVNAFCFRDDAFTLKSARESEARWMKGEPLGLIDGVTVSIKDLMMTKGWPTLKGSKTSNKSGPWTEDSPVTARIREHGGVIVGKTTTPEFGWIATGSSPLTGHTRNPWSLDHTPGGSSAGAAAGLASGMCALAVGTDGAGSIRIPSSFCGLAGLKPTLGRVPNYPASGMGILGHAGPMARTMRDVALLLNVIAITDPRDPYHLPPERGDFRATIDEGVKGLKIAFSPTLGYAKVDPEVSRLVADAARKMESLGAIVEEVDPGFQSPRDALVVLWKAGAANIIANFTAEQMNMLDPGFRRAAEAGRSLSAVDYVKADFIRTALGCHMGLFHQRYDLLLTPTVAQPALPVGAELSDPATERDWIDWAPFCYPFNMTRQPAASVPCGLTSKGLPVGLQIVGPLYAEALVLRAAQAFEAAQPAPPWPPLGRDFPSS